MKRNDQTITYSLDPKQFILDEVAETLDQDLLKDMFKNSETVYCRMFKELELHIENKIATIILNRPQASNSINLAMANALQQVLACCAGSSHVKVICIKGKGIAFCAGQDLKEVIAPDAPALDDFLFERHHPVLDMIRNMPKPVIAAVNGAAAGAGMSLALCCDIVIAKYSASFIQSFSKIALVPDCGSTYMLPRMAGLQKSKAMMMLAEPVSAQQAEDWGLIYKAVPDETFDTTIDATCKRLATMPSQSMGWIKETLNKTFDNDWHSQLALEASLLGKAGDTKDFKEGVNAFLEKRIPQFQ
ncbi:MAG: enoyl-CoA hydratase-related protein [Ferruginibacter sp.]